MENILKYFKGLSEEQISQFKQLEALYTDWNSKINVISRKDIDKLYLHHVLHSMVIGKILPFQDGSKIIDIGTGGGFPGIPLAILFPNCEFTLLDSVGKKIKVASEVANAIGLKNVRLVHSEFSKKDRRTKETDIFNCGKTDNEEDCIWVTTQIVEASLDIDFDYLFTEMSDLSGLFQRLGRINRKGKKPINEYNCFVYLKTNKYLLNRMIDEAIYKLSCEAIKTLDGYLSETKKLDLIEEYLTNCLFWLKSELLYGKFVGFAHRVRLCRKRKTALQTTVCSAVKQSSASFCFKRNRVMLAYVGRRIIRRCSSA